MHHLRRSELQILNFFIISMGKMSFQLWPLSLNMSFNNSQEVIMGKIYATRMRIKCCLILLLLWLFVFQIKTKVFIQWSLSRPGTSEDASSSETRVTLGGHNWYVFSASSSKCGVFFINFARLTSPNFSNLTNFMALLSALC